MRNRYRGEDHAPPRAANALLLLVLLVLLLPVGLLPAHAGQEGKWQGTFYYTEILGRDGENQEIVRSLVEEDGETEYRLRFGKDAPGPDSSSWWIIVQGTLEGDTIDVDAYSLEPPHENPVKDTSKGMALYHTAVILVEFQHPDGSIQALPCSAERVEDIMFTDPADASVDDLYRITSDGRVGFEGDVLGPFTVPYYQDPGGSCFASVMRWERNARDAARQAGYDLSSYDRIEFVYPDPSLCSNQGYGGFASLLRKTTHVFFCGVESIYAHELGHTFGLNHAARQREDGSIVQYGDFSDFMGGVWRDGGWVSPVELNAPHREDADWLTAGQVREVDGCGVFEVSALELGADEAQEPHVLKVDKPDTGETYYLSYRGAFDFDANLADEYLERVSVHRWSGAGRTVLLDTLGAGDEFDDPVNDYEFRVLDHDADSATVEVLIHPGMAQTTAEASPASQLGDEGVTLHYTLSITNEDCLEHEQATTYDVTAAVPGGELDVRMSPTRLTLAPGETGTVAIDATALTREAGTYRMRFDVDGGKKIHRATAQADYVIDRDPPSTPTNLQGFGGEAPAYLRWTASTDDAGVDHYVVYRDGRRIAETVETHYYDHAVYGVNTYTYRVQAVDVAGQASGLSDPVDVLIESPTKPNLENEASSDGGK